MKIIKKFNLFDEEEKYNLDEVYQIKIYLLANAENFIFKSLIK